MTPPAPAPAPAPAPDAASFTVFEDSKDGKIYVFSSVQALTAFDGGQAQPVVKEMPELNPGKAPIVIEAADDAEAEKIIAGYKKLHPVAK